MAALTPAGSRFRRPAPAGLPSSLAPPLPDLLPPTTPDVTPVPPWLGTRALLLDGSRSMTSPFTRRLVHIRRRIVFTCVAVGRVPITLLSTPPRGDAVALRLSTCFMVFGCAGSPTRRGCAARRRTSARCSARTHGSSGSAGCGAERLPRREEKELRPTWSRAPSPAGGSRACRTPAGMDRLPVLKP